MWKAVKSFRKVINNQFECASKAQGAAPLQSPFCVANNSETQQEHRKQQFRRNPYKCRQYYRYFRRKARESFREKSSRPDSSLGQGFEKDRGWQRWQNNTEFIANQQIGPNIFVGWGAILAFGLHFSKVHRKHDYGNKEKKCPWYQVASSMPQGIAHVLASTARKNVAGLSNGDQKGLPEPQYLAQAGKDFLDISHSGSSVDGDFTKLFSSEEKEFQTSTKSSSFCEEGELNLPTASGTNTQATFAADNGKTKTSTEVQSIAEAWAEFQGLTRTYSSIEENILALQEASEGNLEEASKHWHSATQASDYASAQFNLGVCYEYGKGVEISKEKAFDHYQKAAAQGHAKAAYNLAILYLEGEGQHKNEALSLLEKAAEYGIAQAQTELGTFYTEEETRDLKKAASLFEMAANQGDPDGQYCLGICYEQGWGVEQNECKAADLYRKAAKHGHDGAQYNLGVYFESGRGGLPVSSKSAVDLYEQASKAGNEDAKHNLDRLLTLEALDLITSNINTGTTDNSLDPLLKGGLSSSQISSQTPQLSSMPNEDLGLAIQGTSNQSLDRVFSGLNIADHPEQGTAVPRPVFQLGASEDDCVAVMNIYQNRSSIHSSRLDYVDLSCNCQQSPLSVT